MKPKQRRLLQAYQRKLGDNYRVQYDGNKQLFLVTYAHRDTTRTTGLSEHEVRSRLGSYSSSHGDVKPRVPTPAKPRRARGAPRGNTARARHKRYSGSHAPSKRVRRSC